MVWALVVMLVVQGEGGPAEYLGPFDRESCHDALLAWDEQASQWAQREAARGVTVEYLYQCRAMDLTTLHQVLRPPMVSAITSGVYE